jgi:hypothetical protein
VAAAPLRDGLLAATLRPRGAAYHERSTPPGVAPVARPSA